MGHARFDIVALLDAVYAVDQPAEEWSEGLVSAASELVDLGGGVGTVRYNLHDDGRLNDAQLISRKVSDEWFQIGINNHRDPAQAREFGYTYSNTEVYRVGEPSPHLGMLDSYLAEMRRHRVEDQWIVNGFDRSGIGAALYLFGRREVRLTAPQRQMLRKLASHLRAARRLQQRIACRGIFESVDGVLSPDGRWHHARPGLADEAATRRVLSEAVRFKAWARGRDGRNNPQKTVRASTLVNGVWSLVDWCDRDGKRYVLASRNLSSEAMDGVLSAREHEVATQVARGRSNKYIAFELGLAHSTVRVLVARAMRKLGLRSRDDLARRMLNGPHVPTTKP